MHVTLVQIHVKQEHIADLIAACRADHQDPVRKAGNPRFDIPQDAADPARFVLYEAYRDAAVHKDTARYSRRRERVAPWMAEPRLGVKYIDLFPETR